MIKAVLDTNVFVSAAVKPGGLQHKIWEAWREGDFQLITSDAIIQEIERALEYPKLRRLLRLSPEEIREMVQALRQHAEVVPGDLELEAVPDDPSDDKFVACAVEAGADLIVSGDQHLLKLGHYQAVRIVSGREFLATLREERRRNR